MNMICVSIPHVYVYIYIYTHVCVCLCIHSYIYIYIYIYIYFGASDLLGFPSKGEPVVKKGILSSYGVFYKAFLWIFTG